tara:strand:- start:433 stop:726 length:294 start_codon:yes stop_codon:yes gene_type:complete
MSREEHEESIERLSNWLADHRQNHTDIFNNDMDNVLRMAAVGNARNQVDVPSILLSDEFLKKLAAAFAKTPMPSTVTVFGSTDYMTADGKFIETGRQ